MYNIKKSNLLIRVKIFSLMAIQRINLKIFTTSFKLKMPLPYYY